MKPTMEKLTVMVEEWAYKKGIISGSNPRAQLLKAVSELGELCDAEIKDNYSEQIDAVGDVLVCLIIYCHMKGYDIDGCLEMAYQTISNRTGRMIKGGVFVKDE